MPKIIIEPARANNPQHANLRREADRWMRENPDVYALFVRFAKEMLTTGRKFGIGLLAERVRWECAFLFKEDYKVNNNHRAYVARRLVDEYPDLGFLMRFRETRY